MLKSCKGACECVSQFNFTHPVKGDRERERWAFALKDCYLF